VANSSQEALYNEQYFQHGCGPLPYERNEEWLGHFGRIADMIARTINPATMLDAGCAMGFLVEALRDRGIDAYGIDISDYAIDCVRDDIKPFCWVGSLTESLPRHYDLITCIEVLEHLPKEAGMRAIAQLCEATNDIIFSSSPDDYTESTHFNVQPPEYWAAAFAAHGFSRDVDFDGYLISPWAVRFRKTCDTVEHLVRSYERKLWPLNKQVTVLRQSLQQKVAESTQRGAALDQQQQRSDSLVEQLAQEQGRRQELEAQIRERAEQLTLLNARLSQETKAVEQLRRALEAQQAERQRLETAHTVSEQGRHKLAQRLADIERRRSWQLLDRAWQAQMRLAPPASVQGRAWLALTRLGRRNTTIREHQDGSLPLRARVHGAETAANQPMPTNADDFSKALAYNSYSGWASRCEQLRYNKQREIQVIAALAYTPIISIVMPTYNSPPEYLHAAIQSVTGQYYPHWELCICDDASPNAEVRDILRTYAENDPRIKITLAEQNTGIGGASNRAIALATGEYIGLLDHDDVLTPDALLEVVYALQTERADFVYSDEDKLDTDGSRCDPFLKPGWSPDLLLTCMYTGHFSVYRRTIINEIGGFRVTVDGSQDYDLVLRFTERAETVIHVPKILYHWRKIPGSAAASIEAKPYAYLAAQRALTDALERRRIDGKVEFVENGPGYYHVRRTLKSVPSISILIPTRDRRELLERCIDSIERQTDYHNYEIIIIDNESREATTLAYLDESRHRVVRVAGAFNYSRLNNVGAREAKGDYLLLLNNDTEVLTPNWLTAMLEQAQRPEVGAVGAKLLYPDGLIQHAGVILGLGGIASHAQRYVDGYTGTGYFNYANSIKNYSAVTGACLMIRRDVFEQEGGLNEQQLPINFNDVDLCLRLRQRGYLIVYTPLAMLRHHESATREPIVDEAGHRYMLERWGEELLRDPYYNPQFDLTAADCTIDVSRPDIFRTTYIQCLQEGVTVDLATTTVGQRFTAIEPNLSAIGLQFATYGRACTGTVTLHLRTSPTAREDLVTITADAAQILDNRHFLFTFDPLRDSADRAYYFFVEYRPNNPAIPLAIWKSTHADSIAGEHFAAHRPQQGTLSFGVYTTANQNRHSRIASHLIAATGTQAS
jgi:GT2 family glycosyltransferase